MTLDVKAGMLHMIGAFLPKAAERNQSAIGVPEDQRGARKARFPSMRSPAMTDPVERLIRAIESASIPSAGVFAPEAVLDATVPNWRFKAEGAGAVETELAGWFADPGRFEELNRLPLPGGELVEFVLSWEEEGEPHTCHQVHLLEVRDSSITRDTAFCGGRWGAALMAEMAEAGVASA
jgi:hypothetical protein